MLVHHAALPLVVFALACSSAPPTPEPRCPGASLEKEKPSDSKATNPAEQAKIKADETRLVVAITPSASSASIAVTVTLHAPDPKRSTSFSIRAPQARLFRMTRANDTRGPLKTREEEQKGRVVVTFDRAPEGDVTLSYVASTYVPADKLPWMLSDPDRLEISGEALLLPDAEEDAPITATLKIDTEPYGTQESGASVNGVATSFGVGLSGQSPVTTTARELRGVVLAAGRMGTAVFDSLEGHDEAAWFGYTAFDPRPVAADTAAFRTAAGELFGERGGLPQTFLILPESRPIGTFVAARRARSVLLHVGVAEPWSGALRISTAVEVLHAWVGERLWVGPEDQARSTEALWFAGGIARELARDMLFRFGLITPSEVEAEVNGLEAILATSPHAQKSNAELAAHAEEPGVGPLLVARGALYGLRVDAAIRTRTKGKRGLQDVLRELYTKAKEKRGPLPTSAWIEKMVEEIGKGESDTFVKAIEKGEKLDLPADALGPCFKRDSRTYERYDLGFDEFATRAKVPPVLLGLRPGGPAEKAGLRAGDVLVEAKTTYGRSDIAVLITVKRGEEEIIARYEPKGTSASGRGWSRRKDVPDESCTK